MTLSRWTESKGLTDTAAAELLGIDQSMVTKLKNRTRNASLSLALEIERRTGAEIGANELPLTKNTRRALRLLRESQNGSPSVSAA